MTSHDHGARVLLARDTTVGRITIEPVDLERDLLFLSFLTSLLLSSFFSSSPSLSSLSPSSAAFSVASISSRSAFSLCSRSS